MSGEGNTSYWGGKERKNGVSLKKKKLKKIEIELTYNLVSVYGVRHSDLIHVFIATAHMKCKHPSPHILTLYTFFFLVMRNFKFYSPNNLEDGTLHCCSFTFLKTCELCIFVFFHVS